jgi:transcriptional antiterminator
MRFPNQRLAQLFTLLQNETLPQEELAQRLSVSTRTVRAHRAERAAAALRRAVYPHRGSGYQLVIHDPTRYQTLEESAPKAQHIPRTAADRIHFLLVRFLTSAFSIKLEDLADAWFVSRATLQGDMVDVRERFQRYQLTLETRPRHGMKLFGSEVSIRACLTDLLWELSQQGPLNPLIGEEAFDASVPTLLAGVLQETLTRHHVRLTDAGERFICLYGAVAVRRVSEGYPLAERRGCGAKRARRRTRAGEHPAAAGGQTACRRKRSGCASILPPVRCRTSIRAPSAPTTTKRW